MGQRDKSPSRFDDNKRTLETVSTLNKDLHSTKKNLYIQEFQLDDLNKNGLDNQASNRIITLTAENIDVGDDKLRTPNLPTPMTPEEKLRRYLSLKLSADFRDLHELSKSSATTLDKPTAQTPFGSVARSKSYQVFSMFLAKQQVTTCDLRNSSSHPDIVELQKRGSRRLGDFICLPDFGTSTRVDQLRDADSILDSLFS